MLVTKSLGAAMQALDYGQLISDIKEALAGDDEATFAIIGHTPMSYDLLAFFGQCQAMHRLLGIYDAATSGNSPNRGVRLKSFADLQTDVPTIAVIASDENKEKLIEQATPYLT